MVLIIYNYIKAGIALPVENQRFLLLEIAGQLPPTAVSE
jgi:hypothetical protein